MRYLRFELGFSRHRKVHRLSDAAFRFWASAIDYSREQATNGELTAEDLEAIARCPMGAKRAAVVTELVAAKLWQVTDSGWQIHGYLNWQDNSEQVAQHRAEARERMARVRANRKRTRSEHHPNKNGSSEEVLSTDNERGEKRDDPPPEGNAVSRSSGRCVRPVDNPLTDSDYGKLEIGLPGLTRAFADQVVLEWMLKPTDAKKLLFPDEWRSYAVSIVTRTWGDRKRRGEVLEALKPATSGNPLRPGDRGVDPKTGERVIVWATENG